MTRRNFRVVAARRLLGAGACACLCVAAEGVEFNVVNLHPAGAVGSQARAVLGGQQVGFTGDLILFQSNPSMFPIHAALWTGSAPSWVDLNPMGAPFSAAQAIGGGFQWGLVQFGAASRASRWTGAPGSWADISPGPLSAGISGADALHQVGSFEPGSHATLWSGVPFPVVDLNPAGAMLSDASGVDGGRQVGSVTFPGTPSHAALWSGTAASFVDLNPVGAAQSEARGVSASLGEVAGWANFTGPHHAALWNGTAASFADLNPASASASAAYGEFAGVQVGYAKVGGAEHAALWSGSAATWVDLHSYLSNIFTESNANGVWSDGATTFVVGWGFNSVTHRTEALMWLGIGVRPPCRPDFNHNGMVTVSDIFDFLAAWFQGNPSADINGQGLSVSDIFAFLSAWFMGCP